MKGVLLVNLGSPDSPTPKDVKPYLDEFLMDKYVIDVPFLLRALLVRGIILRKRPEESAHAYAKIWWKEGSPLIVLSERMHKKVQPLVKVPVALAKPRRSFSRRKPSGRFISKMGWMPHCWFQLASRTGMVSDTARPSWTLGS